MSTTTLEPVRSLPAFSNEPVADFSKPANREAMEKALGDVRAQFGREYDLLIAGRREKTPGQAAVAEPVAAFVRSWAFTARPRRRWRRKRWNPRMRFSRSGAATPAETRVDMLLRAGALIRKRKFEFDAWLVYEAGKTWPEADADVSEAIDFCEYYARQMLRLAKPDPMLQLPGEKDDLLYLPLGVGIIVPPWNFPLAIMAGMTTAALVAGNTVVIKPSSDTPTIAAKFAEVLLEAGFPAEVVFAAGRQRLGDRRRAGGASQDALRRVHRDRATSGCASTSWPPSRARDRSGSSA